MKEPPNQIASGNPVAFPTLSAAQMEALAPFGKRIRIAEGEAVWKPGNPNTSLFVVIEGQMPVRDGRSGLELVTHGPGNFSGDIDVISGRPSLVGAYAATDLDLLQISGEAVRSIVGQRPDIGDIILRAFLLRRSLQQESGRAGLLVVGSRFDPATLRLREFLARSRYPMVWQDIESDPDAKRMLEEFEIQENETPVVVLPSGQVLRRPSNTELGVALGTLRPIEDVVVDLVVVGAGPAGLAAAVYGASEGLKTIVLDADAPGGQAGTSSRIENYMGFPFGISGQALADGAVAQAERFGARFIAPSAVTSLKCSDVKLHELEVEGVGRITTRCVVIATGARYQTLDVDRISEYEGRGIYYAATHVERIVCGTQTVAVVGAGNSAGQAAVFLSETVDRVLLIVRGENLRRTMSSYLALRIENLQHEGKIEILLESEICAVRGQDMLEGVTIRNRRTGQAREEPIRSVFVMIGAIPCTQWLRDGSKIALSEKGFVIAGSDLVARNQWQLPRSPFFLETSCPGVFAAGDAREGSIKRVASAVGEGSMAVALVHQFLAL